MSGWGCPHEIEDRCTRINDLPCDPGMKGCVLYGRYRFANEEKNSRWNEKQERAAGVAHTEVNDGTDKPTQ